MERGAIEKTIRPEGRTVLQAEYGSAFPEVVAVVARRVIVYLTERSDVCGISSTSGRLDAFDTLMGLAERLGCTVEIRAGGAESYCPDEDADVPSGAIMLDVTEPVVSLIRHLLHEISHHVLWWRMIWITSKERDCLDALGSREDTEEMICRAVQELVVALPSGLQWNGKLAIPRGDGRVRFYRRVRRAPASLSMPADEIDRLAAEDTL